jgi:type IV secretion system protein VirB4
MRPASDAYRDRLMANRLFRNELFLSVVLRSASSAGVAEGRT